MRHTCVSLEPDPGNLAPDLMSVTTMAQSGKTTGISHGSPHLHGTILIPPPKTLFPFPPHPVIFFEI